MFYWLKKIKRYAIINFSGTKDQTQRIISFWEKDGVDFEYFNKADNSAWVDAFWNQDSLFLKMFKKLDLTRILEIACGTARHSAMVIDRIDKLYLLDSSEGALEKAKERFSGRDNVVYVHNKSGLGIPQERISDGSLTAVFSYDAMVHFEKEAVASYVKDSFRVLSPGGYALFHHSIYDKNPNGTFTDNPCWRNYMTKELFTSYALEAGFEVVQSEIILFSSTENLEDGITLLRKPEA